MKLTIIAIIDSKKKIFSFREYVNDSVNIEYIYDEIRNLRKIGLETAHLLYIDEQKALEFINDCANYYGRENYRFSYDI